LRERELDAGVDTRDRQGARLANTLRAEAVWRQSQACPLAMNMAREGRAPMTDRSAVL
jgi:hypothetical protein